MLLWNRQPSIGKSKQQEHRRSDRECHRGTPVPGGIAPASRRPRRALWTQWVSDAYATLGTILAETCQIDYVLGMTSPGLTNILELYQRVLAAGVLEYLQ